MKRFLIVMVIFRASLSFGQGNLVVDSSFEQYNYIPDGFLRAVNISKILPAWIAPTDGTPDYFHLNATNQENSIPYNGYKTIQGIPACTCFQFPRSGNGMVGIGFRKDFQDTLTINEYLQTKLNSPMVKNHLYSVSFYVNRSSCSILALSNIGAYLSKDSIRQYYPNSYDYPNFTNFKFPIKPQVTDLNLPIIDTVSWLKIKGIYKANGGENWITIGHFKSMNENMIVYDTFQKGTNPYAFSYYYIDDVSIYETKGVIYPDTVCWGDSIKLSSNYKAPFKWIRHGIVASTDSVYKTRLFNRETIILESSESKDTFTIHVNSGAYFKLINDSFLCLGDSLIVTLPEPASSSHWSDSFIGIKRTFITAGTYSVRRDFDGCTHSDTLKIEARNKPTGLVSNFREICNRDTSIGIIELAKNYSYFWKTDSDTSHTKSFQSSGAWPIRVTGSNSCHLDTFLKIEELCKPIIWTPDVFVPEGINKQFTPVTVNVKTIVMKIFNRWGELIYSETGDSVSWNGEFMGNICPDGVYIYTIQYSGYNDIIYKANGVVRLMR